MNKMTLCFDSRLENEAFARTSVVAFLMPLNLSMEDLMEIKTMMAEAVVNAMIHGYEGGSGDITVFVSYDKTAIHLEIQDEGCGIMNVEEAMQPMFTSKAHLERSGMGMTIMQSFADDFQIVSEAGKGTIVNITKYIAHGNQTE